MPWHALAMSCVSHLTRPNFPFWEEWVDFSKQQHVSRRIPDTSELLWRLFQKFTSHFLYYLRKHLKKKKILLREGVFQCILFVEFMQCSIAILQVKFKLYYRNYFYIIFRTCHRAIFCTVIVTGFSLGRVTCCGKGHHSGLLGFKCFLLFVQIPSERGNV